MANFNLVIDSKFKPFSYEEMLAPLIASTQAHQALEDQYAELEANASVWDKLKDSELDKVTYNRYKDYMGEVVDSANILTTKGLTLDAKRKALAAKRDYRKIVVPIEEAYARRAKQMEEQNKGRAAGLVYNTLAQDTSLEDYIHNDTLQHQFADSNAGYKRVQSAANAIMKQLDSYSRGKPLDAYTSTWLQQHGYRDTEVTQAINDMREILSGRMTRENARGNNVLMSILEDEMNTSGVNTWGNSAARQDYFNRIAPALYGAVGQTQIGTFENYGARLNAKIAAEAAQRKKEEVEKALRDIYNKSWGFGQGKVDGYEKLLENLKAGVQGLKADYFGKDGKVNIMKAYEEYKKNNIENAGTPAEVSLKIKKEFSKEIQESILYNAYKDAALRYFEKGSVKKDVSLEELKSYAKNDHIFARYVDLNLSEEYIKHKIAKDLGVNKIISDEQYNALKDLGYSGEGQHLSFSEFKNLIDKNFKIRNAYSANLTSYEKVTEQFSTAFDRWNARGEFEGKVYEFNSDGTEGKEVSYDDMKVSKDKNPITDVSYSAFQPNKLIVQVGKGDDTKLYLVDPRVLGTSAAEDIKGKAARLEQDEDKTLGTVAITGIITNYLNSANPIQPTTSSES